MKNSVVFVFLLIVAFVVFWFWTKPAWIETQKLREEQKTFIVFLNKIKEDRILRDDLLSIYNSIPASELERLNKMVPKEIDKEKILVQFEDLALKNGVMLKNIDIVQQKKEDGSQKPSGQLSFANEAMLNLDIGASYENFLNFLRDVEKSLRLIDLEEITLQTGKENFYNFKLKAKTYFQK